MYSRHSPLATDLKGWDSKTGGGQHFSYPSIRAPRSTQPPVNGYWVSFRGVKRPGRRIDHPPPLSAEVKEILELHLYSSSGPSWPAIG
jgi:hypothetical protein